MRETAIQHNREEAVMDTTDRPTVTMPADDLAVIADLTGVSPEKVRGIVWLAEKHLREHLGPTLPEEVVRTSRAHSDHLIAELRNIAHNMSHTPSNGEFHIDEPTTGGHQFCGPCRAWRVLNGTPDAHEASVCV